MRAVDRTYRLLVDPGGGDGAGALPDRVADAVPANALRQIAALGLQKAGDLVVDPKTVLVWLLGVVGAPAAFAGLLVPVREAGSMLPQVAMVGWVRRRHIRKDLWLLSAVGQAAAAAGMAIVALVLQGAAAGVAVVALLAAFATARALGSITTKDVLGKTMPKGQRGRVTGAASVVSGAVAITLGVALRVGGGEDASPFAFGLLLGAGAATWVAAAWVFSRVQEEPGEVDADDDAGSAIGRAVRLLREDRDFRRFILARGLLLVSALSPPFVVTLAAREGGGGLQGLGPFVIGSGVASLVGGRLWGPQADRSSRQVMVRAAGGATAVIVVLLALLPLGTLAEGPLLLPAAYLLLALAHEGSRIGRKTYVVDLAEGNERTDYVAVSNTAMAVVLLLAGALTAAVSTAGPEWGLAALVVFGVLAVLVARSLPEVAGGAEGAESR